MTMLFAWGNDNTLQTIGIRSIFLKCHDLQEF